MSPRSARALSTAVVGGLAAMVFFRFGLFFWAGVVAWAVLAEAGDNPSAMKLTLGGSIFGAVVAWAAILVSALIPVPPEGWMWVPRLGVAVALSLYLLEMATATPLFSNRLACLLGYASLFGVAAVTAAEANVFGRYTGPHLSNPLVGTVLALIGGVLAGQIAKSMTGALSKS